MRRDEDGITALHMAIAMFGPSSAPSEADARRDATRIVSMIEARANIEAAAMKEEGGCTPLALAAEQGNTPLLRLLLAAGAVASGYPALFIAAQKGEG